MANYDPLQDGDETQGATGASGPTFRYGMPEPSGFLKPPFGHVTTDEGAGDRVVEVDIFKYGDAFDQNAPTRVRDVGGSWSVDTDHDGEKN